MPSLGPHTLRRLHTHQGHAPTHSSHHCHCLTCSPALHSQQPWTTRVIMTRDLDSSARQAAVWRAWLPNDEDGPVRQPCAAVRGIRHPPVISSNTPVCRISRTGSSWWPCAMLVVLSASSSYLALLPRPLVCEPSFYTPSRSTPPSGGLAAAVPLCSHIDSSPAPGIRTRTPLAVRTPSAVCAEMMDGLSRWEHAPQRRGANWPCSPCHACRIDCAPRLLELLISICLCCVRNAFFTHMHPSR